VVQLQEASFEHRICIADAVRTRGYDTGRMGKRGSVSHLVSKSKESSRDCYVTPPIIEPKYSIVESRGGLCNDRLHKVYRHGKIAKAGGASTGRYDSGFVR
jgi:hypothetical protein